MTWMKIKIINWTETQAFSDTYVILQVNHHKHYYGLYSYISLLIHILYVYVYLFIFKGINYIFNIAYSVLMFMVL